MKKILWTLNFIFKLIIIYNLIVISVADIIKENEIKKYQHKFNQNPDDLRSFQCFDKTETDEYRNFFNAGHKKFIGIQVTERITHQLTSRIFGIYLREILGYQNVQLMPIYFDENINEQDKMYYTLKRLIPPEDRWPSQIIDLEVWMYPNYHAVPWVIGQAGLMLDPGRFGWFIPKDLIAINHHQMENYYQSLHFSVFTNPKSLNYQNYVIDKNISDEINFGKYRKAIPNRCRNLTCVTIFAEHFSDTSFIKNQIMQDDDYEFYVQVIWLEDEFRNIIEMLHSKYKNTIDLRKRNKNFILLHWTPSDIIDSDIEYEMITMPKCESMDKSSNETLCKYEMTPILKYYTRVFQNLHYGFHTIFEYHLSRKDLVPLLIKSNEARKLIGGKFNDDMKLELNKIACNWLKLNKNRYPIDNGQNNITIGGIFPITGAGRAYGDIIPVVEMAIRAINANKLIIPGYNLSITKNDGACRSDTVMKAFIHYFGVVHTPLIGVLGPACSETVEPIAGISKHTRMTVISYSAEGALFTDRETYPYFFRTIGSNRQYEKVFLDLFKHLKWRRFAALTEDGQKYTEYISHMETLMKQENMELIFNKKFTKDVNKSGMRRLLLELKNKNAKIIIADIYNDNAQLVMCEAYQLQMTAKYGYVWFLPVWLSKTWTSKTITNGKKTINCTEDELNEAIDGHFSLNHAPFASNSSILELENKTVGEWLDKYNSPSISNYAGFVYDAVWVYALAIDKLLRDDPTAINDIRSEKVVKKFVDFIWETDFNGLSGKIKFDSGGSRINDVNILQWTNNEFNQIGQYVPTTIQENSTLKISGGNLFLNDSLIIWLSTERPTDGTFVCQLASLAEFLYTDCDNVIIILTSILCLILVVTISFASFMFWKRQYYKKLKRSAKVMRNFGIDLLSPNAQTFNTLDKWEVPKEKIVINRRLGEGAFGTVYGGEAQLTSDAGWTAVAVKTLKSGASTEDRLDFLSEAEAMKRFDHKNIVKFLGVCLQTEPIYTIMEFMLYGDLKTFLLARRHLVNEKVTDDSDISPKRLTMYTMDLARGLSYLADEKYVHRDIACRNCLINAQRVAKIGDFGMARTIFENDYYRFSRKGMLPVRWMAPESLGLGLFTPSSDVWSFGVLLFEIITFGAFPYQGLTNNEALEHINRGETLSIPQGAKPHLEALMKACWSQDKKKRPLASEIVEYISNNPRLLTPCIDVPLSSVQMAETDSDQMEILPGLRKRIATQTDLDLLTRGSNINNFDQQQGNSLPRTLKSANIPLVDSTLNKNSTSADTNSNDESNIITYSVMSPLLKMDPQITNSNSSLRRYVPMYGHKSQHKLMNNCSVGLTTCNGGNFINKTNNQQNAEEAIPNETVSIL